MQTASCSFPSWDDAAWRDQDRCNKIYFAAWQERAGAATMDDDKVQDIIDKYDGDAGSLIQILLDIQKECRWLSQETLEKVGASLKTPLSLGRLQQTASFFKAFNLVPRGRHEVHVCMGTSCYVNGAPRILEAVQEELGIRPGETDMDLRFSLETVNCLGCCQQGPVMAVDGQYYGDMTPEKAIEILKNCD
jgi:NADH-quinone oxidoreductase subunit E